MGFMSRWWGTPEDARVVDQLAAEVAANIRPELTVTRVQALSVNKTTRILERILKRASDYQVTERMGMIRRARFANQFQWALRGRGFSAEFAALAAEGLVVSSTRKPTAT